MSADASWRKHRGRVFLAALIISAGAVLGYQGPHRVAIEKLQRRGVLVLSYDGSTRPLAGIDSWSLYQRWFPQETYVVAAGPTVFERDEATAIYEPRGGRLRNADLARLEELPQARELDLQFQDQIGDEGLAHLRGHPGIAILELRGSGASEASLAILKTMPALRSLAVSGRAFSAEALARFKKVRPEVAITVD